MCEASVEFGLQILVVVLSSESEVAKTKYDLINALLQNLTTPLSSTAERFDCAKAGKSRRFEWKFFESKLLIHKKDLIQNPKHSKQSQLFQSCFLSRSRSGSVAFYWMFSIQRSDSTPCLSVPNGIERCVEQFAERCV